MILAVLLLFAGACASDGGNYRNVELSPQDWVLPGPGTETQVFGPMPYEQVKHFVRGREAAGWDVVGYEPAGRHLEGEYLVIMRRWK
ncbi:MAG: hypothetical protein HYY17_06550 [Planctomycetes bacterium]|nr:hypothetical protein [Planctomycetota bacterium]